MTEGKVPIKKSAIKEKAIQKSGKEVKKGGIQNDEIAGDTARPPAVAGDIGDIFSSLQKEKAVPATSVQEKRTPGKKDQKAQRAPKSSDEERCGEKRPRRVPGVFYAPTAGEEMNMSDKYFFSKGNGACVKRSNDGLRVMTEDEILRATNASSKRSGTTEHCPFDCDCCF